MHQQDLETPLTIGRLHGDATRLFGNFVVAERAAAQLVAIYRVNVAFAMAASSCTWSMCAEHMLRLKGNAKLRFTMNAMRPRKEGLTHSHDFLDGLAERVDLLECRVDVRSYANALELWVDDRNDDDAMLLPEAARDRIG